MVIFDVICIIRIVFLVVGYNKSNLLLVLLGLLIVFYLLGGYFGLRKLLCNYWYDERVYKIDK